MNRARPRAILVHTLLCLLMCAVVCGSARAQNRKPTPRTVGPAGYARSRAVQANVPHPFMGTDMNSPPSWVTRRRWDPKFDHGGSLMGKKGTRYPGDQGVPRQTVLLTNANPDQPFPIVPAASENQHPFWTADERFIYFDSNRNSQTDSSSTSGYPFNIFRMYPDGSGVLQVLPDTAHNQIEPSVTTDGSLIAFVAGGQYTAGGGTATPTTTGFNLYTLNLNNPGQATPITNQPGSQFTFTDVRHPSWSPNANQIAFAGKTATTPYHIYLYTLSTNTIIQMTSGPSNDYSPAFSPDGNLIAYTTNASGYASNGPAPVQSTGVVGNDDIYVISQNAFQPHPLRVTNFAANGAQSSNRNPAWSSTRTDPRGEIPPENGQSGNTLTQSEQLIAFASTRVDSNNDGVANAVGSTTDIYFLHARIQQVTPGVYTVATPESASNPAVKLRTSAPDAALDPNEPTYNFDLGHVTNEDFPTWPQYQNSYRMVFQSDRGGSLEIWASAILDLDAPTLLKYNQATNEIVHIERDTGSFNPAAPGPSVREVNAGEAVRFVVAAGDYQSGVESVFVQIKCPNSFSQGVDGVEHKVFVDPGGGIFAWIAGSPTSPTFAIDAPYEFDYQAVDANTPVINTFPRFKTNNGYHSAIPSSWPAGNLYTPGLDDEVAFTGGIDTPDVPSWVPPNAPPGTPPVTPKDGQGGCWLQLQNIGGGLYTGVWNTPSTFPSDWVVDVILRDKAVNPFDPTQVTNWKIYDNVWGFTTQPFTGLTNCLYVDDYDSGQKFLGSRLGTGSFHGATNFLSQDNSSIGLSFNGTPTESYMTEFDSKLFPTLEKTPTGMPAPLIAYRTTLGINSYGDGPFFDIFDDDGSGYPPTQHYDIWRVQCRGPIPANVLNQYLPHMETNPPDVIGGGGPLQVLVAERCVFWHAPYTGDLFVGPGTLLDGAVQNQLATFVSQGGRLFVCGQDVAWGVTLGGSSPSTFLTQSLHVNFVGDNTSFHGTPLPPLQDTINMTATNPGGQSRGGLPIGWETWYPSPAPGTVVHDYPGAIPDDPPGSGPIYIGSTTSVARELGAPNNEVGIGTPDIVSFAADPTFTNDVDDVDGRFNDADGGQFPSGSPAIMWYTDTTVHSKIVFSPFGWEAINSETIAPPGGGSGLFMLNRRMEMTHNVLDYLRTGRIVGTVRAINPQGGAATPLGGVFVRATYSDPYTGKVTVQATTRTQNDGSYILNGLDAKGVYGLDATKSGFIAQHATSNQFHGSYQSRTDFFMTQAQPGIITGKVLVFGTNAPVQGAIVSATDISNPATPVSYNSSPTDANGNFSISVPSSPSYQVQVTNYVQLGFVASVPPSFPEPGQPPIAVAPNQTVALPAPFLLKQAPGSIQGFVHVADANGKDTGVPIKGATITATMGTPDTTFTTAPPPPGGSDANGNYNLTGVTPGTYSVTATAPGYAPSPSASVTVVTNQETTGVNFYLQQIPPGSISGLVHTSPTPQNPGGTPVSGATVTVVDAAGNTLPSVTTGAPQTITLSDGSSYTFNYVVTNVPAGATAQVTATKPGYTPSPNPDTQTVQVNANSETRHVDFTLNPLFVFNNSLTLVSSPFYFTTDNTPTGPPLDVAVLLGVSSADIANGSFQFITWDNSAQRYVFHPTPPADTFHLGLGYFMQDVNEATILALTNPNGIPAPKDSNGNYLPFNIPLKTGWNMIGMPLDMSVDFSKLQIQDASGNLINVPDAQSGGNPLLGAALWTYANGTYQVVYTLDAFRGYWLRAFQPVTLIVTPSAQTGRAAIDRASRALEFGNTRTGNWKLDLVASTGAATTVSVQATARATLGAHGAATDQYDRYKMEAAPSVTTHGVTLTFDHNDWTGKIGKYAVDVRSPQASTWNFTVRSDVANTPVTLTWPTLAQSGRHDMLLTDLDGNVTFDLHNRSSYTIAASPTPITRHFQLVVQRATRPRLEMTDVAVTMAPSRAPGVAPASASISYSITSDAQVTVSILQAGRRIRSLGGDTRAAGSGTYTWDLKNDRGIPVPNNVYTIEVRAIDTNGHMVHQQRPLVITR